MEYTDNEKFSKVSVFIWKLGIIQTATHEHTNYLTIIIGLWWADPVIQGTVEQGGKEAILSG